MRKLASRICRKLFIECRRLCWRIIGMITKTVTIRTKQGLLTVFCKDTIIGKYLYINGGYEENLTFKVVDLLRGIRKFPLTGKGAILDIGANIGVISIGMIYNNFLDKGIAIEPEPRNFYLLQRNVKQNRLESSIICLPYAVPEKSGKVQLELCGTNLGDHRMRTEQKVFDDFNKDRGINRKVIDVKCVRLDEIIEVVPEKFSNDIALIWIDIQGHEGYAFRSGKTIFSKDIPVVAEIWPYGIKYSGMSQKQFFDIVKIFWSNYYIMRRDKFVCYPIGVLNTLFDELGDNTFTNVIFTK